MSTNDLPLIERLRGALAELDERCTASNDLHWGKLGMLGTTIIKGIIAAPLAEATARLATGSTPPAEAAQDGSLEDNVRYLLNNTPSKFVVRARPDGGPENLTGSLCVTWRKMQDAAEKNEQHAEAAQVGEHGELFGICMLVAEAAWKEATGRDRAVAAEPLKQVVLSVLDEQAPTFRAAIAALRQQLCEGCPPADYGDGMRCAPCPRRSEKYPEGDNSEKTPVGQQAGGQAVAKVVMDGRHKVLVWDRDYLLRGGSTPAGSKLYLAAPALPEVSEADVKRALGLSVPTYREGWANPSTVREVLTGCGADSPIDIEMTIRSMLESYRATLRGEYGEQQ